MVVPKFMLITYLLGRHVRLSVANRYRIIHRIQALSSVIDFSCMGGAYQTMDYYDGVNLSRYSEFIERICTYLFLHLYLQSIAGATVIFIAYHVY